MNRGHLRFSLALALFVGWVIGLGVMAFYSADPPRQRPTVPVAR